MPTPPLAHHRPVAAQIEGAPTREVPLHLPLLGFNHMVAPINQTAYTQNALFSDPTLSGDVYQLPGKIHEAYKVAHGLYDGIRKMSENQQIPPEVANNYLGRTLSLERYDQAFRILWALLQDMGVTPGILQ